MRRCTVEVEVVLLHVLAVVRLVVGQSKEPLLEDGIPPVPQGQGEAEALLIVGDAGQTVFAPTIGARTGMIVGEEIPGVTVFAVVLAHGAPLSLTEVRSPLLPVDLLLTCLVKPGVFGCSHQCPPVA